MEENTERFETKADDVVYDNSKLSGRIRNKIKKAFDWCKSNKEIALFGLITLLGGIIGVADSYNKTSKKKENHEKVYRTIYDRSNGNYVISKKDLTPSQQREINHRRANGEDLYDICNDLNIKLKR